MSLYASLADVRRELNAESTVDDKKVMRYVRQLTSRIDTLFVQFGANLFVPSVQSRSIPLTGNNINSWQRTLMLNRPMMSVTGVNVGSTALVIGTNVQSFPTGMNPFYELQLFGDCALSWYDYCAACSSRYATIAGIWGYNADYAHAWLPVDALDGGIDDTVTTLTVTDVSGDNPYGEAPRISWGNILQIDDEWMDVVGTDTDANTVTVIRGVNGSTAAAHDDEAVVSVYLVDENIRRAVARQAAFQYSRVGAFSSYQQNDVGIVKFNPDLQEEVNNILAMFANM